MKQSSDELIEDLEQELGTVAGVASEYMHIRISYSHSAFPESRPSCNKNIAVVTRLETIVTASIPRQDAKSPWTGARLFGSAAGRENPVLRIIKELWSGDRARASMEKVLSASGSVTRPHTAKQSTRSLPRTQGFAAVSRRRAKQGLENLPLLGNALPAISSPVVKRVSSKQSASAVTCQDGHIRLPS